MRHIKNVCAKPVYGKARQLPPPRENLARKEITSWRVAAIGAALTLGRFEEVFFVLKAGF